ncbi:MAG: RHS repeat-associated core domain-containing protein [Planctomycetota bacterium]
MNFLPGSPSTPDAAPQHPDGPFTPETSSTTLNDPGIPAAAGSTVKLDGSVVYHIGLPEPPAIRSGGIGMGITYRTWTDPSFTEGSATVGFADSLHFSFIDEIHEVDDDLVWITGTGDVNLAVPDTNFTPPQNETWWVVQDHFALSRFRSYTRTGDSQPTLERYRPNGSVMRYEPKPNTTGVWRPAKFFDSYDNAWTYSWRTSDDRIDKITDPRGMETRFSWTVGTPTTCSVSYWKSTQHFTDWDWSMQLDSSSQGRLTSLTLPSTTYLIDDANGPLLDLANPQTDARVISFNYYTSGTGAGLLDTITDSRLSSGGSAYVIRKHTYAVALSQTRVETQIDEQGLVHAFSYSHASPYVSVAYSAAESGAGSGAATTMTFDVPDGVLSSTSSTPWLPVRITVAPGSLGKPRTLVSDPDPEPTSLTWQLTYSGCSCGLVASVTTPSGAAYAFTHDEFGNMTSWTGPSPSGSGTVTHTWSFADLSKAGRPLSYDAPLGVDISYNYTTWNNRSDQIYGQKPQSVQTTTTAITGSSSGTQYLTTTIAFDSNGRPTDITDVGGVVFHHTYGSSGTSGSDLLVSITRGVPSSMSGDTANQVGITIDDLGRITQITEGTSTNQTVVDIVNDGLGRTQRVTTQLGSTGVSPVTEYYRDAFENIALIRRKNLDETGQKPLSTAREWLRNEWHYHYDRLLESYIDRASVELGEDLTDPTGSSLAATDHHLAWMARYQFAYRVDGQFASLTLPNGALNNYEIDGYGTMYRITADVGGLNVRLVRSYFDDDLVLRKQSVVLNSTGDLAVTQFVRNNSGHGPVYRTINPTGLVTDLGYDALGRVLTVLSSQNSVLQAQTDTSYDEAGRPVQVARHLLSSNGTSLGTATTSYDYDIWSNVLQLTDPDGRTVHREFDGYGRLKKVRDGLSSQAAQCNESEIDYMPGRDLVVKSTQRVYDDGSSPAQHSYVTELELDLVGRVIRRQVKGLNGQQTAQTHAYSHDGLGQLVRYQDPDQYGDANRFAKTTFDADGRWVRFVKSASSTDTITLNSKYVDTPGSGKNPTITREDGRGLPTKWIYDAAYRLAEQQMPGYVSSGTAHRTLISYDAGSRPEWVVDGNSNYIHQQWDLTARQFQRTVAPGTGVSLLATEETIQFDPLGRIKNAWTDQGSSWNLLMGGVQFDIDSLGRTSKESFTYTGIEVNSPVDVTSSYVHSGSQVVGDTSFRRTLTYSSGFEIGSVPDPIGRVDTRTLKTPGASSAFNLATYTWGGGTELERVLSIGGSASITKTTALDSYRRLSSLTHQVSGAGSPFEQRSFDWTPGGDLLKRAWTKHDSSQGDLFKYDGHHRLTGAKLGVANISQSYANATAAREVNYNLEPGQSRDSVTESLNGSTPTLTDYVNESDSPRYSDVGGIQPLYDGEGNLVFDGQRYLIYDFKNRLSEVWELQASGSQSQLTMQRAGGLNTDRSTLNRGRLEVLDRFGGQARRAIAEAARTSRSSSRLTGWTPRLGSSTSSFSSESVDFTLVLIAAYGYDPFNRRIARVVPDQDLNVRYAYDGWREVEELVPVMQGETTVAEARKALVWGPEFSELLIYQRWDAQSSSWIGYAVTQDEQGSVTWLHDSSGAEIERTEYDTYGRRTVYPSGGSAQDASTVGLDFAYATYRHDSETRLLFARNRYLQADWGRFITTDPFGSWADLANLGNSYGFVGNAPGDATDPLGLYNVKGGPGVNPANISRDPSAGSVGLGEGRLCLPPGGVGRSGGGKSASGRVDHDGDNDSPDDTPSPGSGHTSTPVEGRPQPCGGGQGPGSQGGGGPTLCELIGQRIDAEATKAVDYGDFAAWARRHSTPQLLGGGHYIGSELSRQNPGIDPGFNTIIAANGAANSNHYLGALGYGTIVASGQLYLDDGLESRFNSGPRHEENLAEVAGDFFGTEANITLSQELMRRTAFLLKPFAGWRNNSWTRVRQLPGQLWRFYFCRENEPALRAKLSALYPMKSQK